MGTGVSKEEALYQAVQKSDHQGVKTLRRDGASLEWRDKEGRTPLILACTRGDLYDMVITLLNEGASLNAYRGGPHGGYPLHHAAKRGLDKTVILLLLRGANPLQLNDDGLTPLDMARNKSHVQVVRIIEDRICLFRGTMRELSGLGILEALVPHLVTKKIWVVVLPAEGDPTKPPRNELVIYHTAKVCIPRTVISLSRADIEKPKFHHHDPTMIVTVADKTGKVRFKFQSENEGDKVQLERLYNACAQGIRQTESGPVASPGQPPAQGLQTLARPPATQLSGPTTPPNPPNRTIQPSSTSPISSVRPPSTGKSRPPSSSASPSSTDKAKPPSSSVSPSDGHNPEEIALAMAINASIISASEEGVPVSPSVRQSSSWDGSRNTGDPSNPNKGEETKFSGWGDSGEQSSYGGWGPGTSAGAGSSKLGPSVADSPTTSESKPGASHPAPSPTTGLNSASSPSVTLIAPQSTQPAPSAPPLPLDGPISYPSVDTSVVELNYASAPAGAPAKQKADEKSGGHCVICWDAPAEAICIPCGHLAGCMDCLSEIKSKNWGCPVCRATIDQVLKVYAV